MGGRGFELRALCITSCSPVYYLLQRAVSRLQKLNPNVAVSADTENIDDKPDNFFNLMSSVQAVVLKIHWWAWLAVTATPPHCSLPQLRLNKLCRQHRIKLFCDVWGYYGYCFTDLQEHCK